MLQESILQYFRPSLSYHFPLRSMFCLFLTGHLRQILYRAAAKSITCLATDASLTADPGVTSLLPPRFHTFVDIDHEIISTVILLPSAESFKKGCCQLQAKVCAQSTGMVNCLFKLAQEKVWLGELTIPP